MSSKARWEEPANVGQYDNAKIARKIMLLIFMLVIATAIKMAINKNWFEMIKGIIGY